MNGDYCSLLALVNLCLSASGRVLVNNANCKNWPGGCTAYTLVMSNSVLSIAMLMVSSSRWGSFFDVVVVVCHDVVDSGLRVKLTEL